MSIFDKLFKKEKKPQEKQEQNDENILNTPYGEFEYDPSPDCDIPEFGYGGDVDWYSKEDYPYDKKYESVGVYLECNTPDTLDAGKSYEIFLRIMSFKERTDTKIKNAITDYFAGDNGLIERSYSDEPISKELFFKDLRVTFFHVYGNRDVLFSVYHHFHLSLQSSQRYVHATLKADGSVEIDPKLYWY